MQENDPFLELEILRFIDEAESVSSDRWIKKNIIKERQTVRLTLFKLKL